MISAVGDVFDYLVVGAGSAGALLAARLAEEPDTTVCLLEAGPRDINPFIGIPAGFIKVIFDEKLTWGFSSAPGPGIGGRSVPAIQGRVVGGSGSINGMIYTRGQPADFDRWAQMGNPGWSYDEVLPYFRKSERLSGGGDPDSRGTSGELPIMRLNWHNELVDAFSRGAGQLGIPHNPDYNSKDQAGVGVYQFNIGNGKRINSARAFLKPALRSGRIDLRTNALVKTILFEGKVAQGVSYFDRRGRSDRKVFARREIILCAGAINTPRLLQVSGIGDAAHLQKIGVDVVHALRGVGENLRDHYTPRTVVRVRGATTINEIARGPKLLAQGVRWLLGRPSVLGIGVVLGHIFWKSHSGLENPDVLVTFTPGSFKEGFLGKLDEVPGMTLGAWQLRPESTGCVRAVSSGMEDMPEIQPNYLTSSNDQQVLLAGQKLIRRLLRETDLKDYVAEELLPGPSARTDSDLIDYAKRQGFGGYHYCGTCKMGPAQDPMAVVDHRLRIHGLSRIRVADASIMPDITSGNTNAPTMMIAEKAADMIKNGD